MKGKGLENMVMTGKKTTIFDKNAFVTPMGKPSASRWASAF